MTDPISRFTGEGDRVDATDGEVPGVEAPLDVAVVEHPLNVARRLNEGLDVRVNDLLKAVLGANLVDDPEHLHHVAEFIRLKCTRHRPVFVHNNRGDELGRPGPLEERGGEAGRCDGGLALAAIM